MALRKGFGAELALPHGNDLRYDLAGTVARSGSGAIRAGLFPPAAATLLTSSATMAVNIAAFSGVAVRDNGVVFLANDGPASVLLANAPSSNWRLDVVYAVQHDASSYVTVPDGDNLPVFGVLQGAASPSPVRNPAGLPAGALELGTVLVPSTATNTGSAGVVITPTFLYTAMAGGTILFRNATERDAFSPSANQDAWLLSDNSKWSYVAGSGWLRNGVPNASSDASRNALFPAPVVGDRVFRTDLGCVQIYSGTVWISSDGVFNGSVLTPAVSTAAQIYSSLTLPEGWYEFTGIINIDVAESVAQYHYVQMVQPGVAVRASSRHAGGATTAGQIVLRWAGLHAGTMQMVAYVGALSGTQAITLQSFTARAVAKVT